MFSIQNLGISLTRGDTAALELTFTSDEPNDVPGPADLVVMALKTSPRAAEAKWEKQANPDAEGKVQFDFAVEDTAQLPFGTYWWDVRIFYADGAVVTPIAPHKFAVLEVVTNDRDE